MKRTGYRYRSGRAAGHYDSIVIGSGIGGLCAAALQARLGRDAMKLMRLVKEWRPGAGVAQ